MEHVAPTDNVPQPLAALKPLLVTSPVKWTVAVPVFDSCTDCAFDAVPAAVSAKVIDPCDVVKDASGGVFDGVLTTAAEACPLRSMKSGAFPASLSTIRVPGSICGTVTSTDGDTW